MPHLEQNFLQELNKKKDAPKPKGLAQTKSKAKLTAEEKSDRIIDAFNEQKKKTEQEEKESKEAAANTNAWAHAKNALVEENPVLPKIGSNPAMGEIELEKKPMSKEEANKILHVVASKPIKEEKSEAQIEKEKYEDRKKTSDELSE